MFEYNQIMALKQLIAEGQGDDTQQQLVQNHYKGSTLNPASIGSNNQKKQIAKPNTKISAKIGNKYIPKVKQQQQGKEKQKDNEKQDKGKIQQSKIDSKHQIWTEQQVKQLPVNLNDQRKQPNFQTLYRQKIGTQDIYLGLSGIDPSSNHCNQMLYKIELPNTQLKDIQIDLNEKQMVLQTKNYYLSQYFQYKTDYKKAKAEFISDKQLLKLTLPIIKQNNY